MFLTEKIKTFLREFYVDGEDGGKDFVYGQQLVFIFLFKRVMLTNDVLKNSVLVLERIFRGGGEKVLIFHFE